MPLTPATTDKLLKVGLPGTATTLAAPGYTNGVSTSINVGATTNWPTDTPTIFAMDTVTITNGVANRTAGTYNEFFGIVTSSTTIGSLLLRYGTPQNYVAGSLTRVYIPVSGTRENDLIDALRQDHNGKGNHQTLTDDNNNEWLERGQVASAINQVKVTNAIAGADPIVGSNGDDTDIGLNAATKGKGQFKINAVAFDPIHSFMNAIINGSCRIAQRVTAPNLSTSYQFGSVDRLAAKATGTAVSAGTISQSTTPNVGATGFSLKLAGVTITGTGIAYLRYRIEAKDALRFKNGLASFSVKVYQDSGGALNYTIFIRKPTATDNFTSVTDIANSGTISVPNTTATTIKFENINTGNIGDVSNGIEIEIQIACGAVTTKNFEFSEFTFHNTSKALPYIGNKSFQEELAACQRYYEKGFSYATAPASGTEIVTRFGSSPTGLGGVATDIYFKVPKRGTPVIAAYGTTGTSWEFFDGAWQTKSGTNTNTVGNDYFEMLVVCASGTGFNDKFPYLMRGNWTADAEL